MEYDIRAKSELLVNVRNNSPITPGLTHDTTVCIIDVIKITYLVGEIIKKKNYHKELKLFLYNRQILHRNAFFLVYMTVFEHMQTSLKQFNEFVTRSIST